MTDRTVVVELARIEAAHLSALVSQFSELLDETEDASDDSAVARLVPDAYVDDAEASREFRDLTQDDLLARRQEDAAAVLVSLHDAALLPEDSDDAALTENVAVVLAPDAVHAWLRTLAAVRLVLATRLGIEDADDHDDEDPRFGIYEWLGYRLDGLVRAIEG
ncbi:DUF2017 family protein [Microbacterium ulmi]|uniref:DUF2017 family protein n=1 Tax=Microbacterium ulmi TaxID=179095 RepID=A0A7Y2LX68_9MICO|nr:DUF2017 family protein [Microbacterium ulmi]NII71183.1 hypothetical protein [Microbacterium ulmi]NNH02489.1 DUF2017 family protein [Microbacterium ulmi]